MPSQSLLAIDVGTSSVKAALVSHAGEILKCARRTYDVKHPNPGWAEQDPRTWWEAICSATRELWATSRFGAEDVSGVVFSTQMLGTLPVDAAGNPLMPCMLWLDTRSGEIAKKLTAGFPRIHGFGVWPLLKWLWITNGAPDLAGGDPVSKIVWLREERPEIWQRTHKVLDVKDYLLFRCTGRMVTTNDLASASWLFSTRKNHLGWSNEVLRMTGIPRDRLPEVIPSSDIVGGLGEEAASDLGLNTGTPVLAGAGDATSCAVGSGAVRDGEVHIYLGTGCLIGAHLDRRAVDLFSATATICAAEADKYLLAAVQQTACGALDWARNHIVGGAAAFSQLDEMIDSCPPGAGGVFFFPWLSGERVPIDDPSARGGFFNLGIGCDSRHLMRAVYEGVALNARWSLAAVEKIIGRESPRLRLVGGGAQSATWCQIFADVLGRPIEQVEQPQFCGVRGAALIGTRALGKVERLEEVGRLVPIRKVYDPQSDLHELYDDAFGRFTDFYKRNRTWFR